MVTATLPSLVSEQFLGGLVVMRPVLAILTVGACRDIAHHRPWIWTSAASLLIVISVVGEGAMSESVLQGYTSDSPPKSDLMEMVVKKGRKAVQRLMDAPESSLDDRRFLLDCFKQFGICYQDWHPLSAFNDYTNPVPFGPIQLPSEFVDYLLIAGRSAPRTVIEIGVFYGGACVLAAAYLLRKNRLLEYTAVDICDRFVDFDHYAAILPIVKAMPATSANFYGQPFDLAFIDGDHQYDSVKRDWLNVGRFAGLTAFHDVRDKNTGTHRYWLEMKAAMRMEATLVEISHVPEMEGNWMGIGLVYNSSGAGWDRMNAGADLADH